MPGRRPPREPVQLQLSKGFFACNRAEQRWLDRPKAFCRMGDDGYVPVICPTCQKVFVGSLGASMPAAAAFFAWGCFRYFWLTGPCRPGRLPRLGPSGFAAAAFKNTFTMALPTLAAN